MKIFLGRNLLWEFGVVETYIFCRFTYFRDLIVSVPDHYLSLYFPGEKLLRVSSAL